MEDKNRGRYDWIWRQMPLQKPDIWASWEICKDFAGKRCLEIGCGNYPRIPLENSRFLDLSEAAVNNLKARGLSAYRGTAEKLPFESNFFDLVVAWDVLEHVPNDRKAFSEVSRVLRPKGHFLFSVPLGKKYFGPWDTTVGHLRRYEATELDKILKENNLQIVGFQTPNLFRYIHKIPFSSWLLSKFVNPPLRQYQLGLPVPHQLRALLIRGYAFLGRALAVPWRTGQLADAAGEVNLVVLCRKPRSPLANMITFKQGETAGDLDFF